MVSLGDSFQQSTKYRRHELKGSTLDWRNKPATYKNYSQASQIKLPLNSGLLDHSFERIVERRHSQRSFTSAEMTLEKLSALLWASQGITKRTSDFEFRATPSAGALYPVETYLVVNKITSLKKGVYHYNIQQHSLETLKKGNYAQAISHACLDQDWMGFANVIFLWSAVFERSIWKYRERAYRYVYLDAGHIAHAVALAATALDLGSCQVAAFYDDEVNTILDIDGTKESTLYLTAVGRVDT